MLSEFSIFPKKNSYIPKNLISEIDDEMFLYLVSLRG